jgi:hypothetical protein
LQGYTGGNWFFGNSNNAANCVAGADSITGTTASTYGDANSPGMGYSASTGSGTGTCSNLWSNTININNQMDVYQSWVRNTYTFDLDRSGNTAANLGGSAVDATMPSQPDSCQYDVEYTPTEPTTPQNGFKWFGYSDTASYWNNAYGTVTAADGST